MRCQGNYSNSQCTYCSVSVMRAAHYMLISYDPIVKPILMRKCLNDDDEEEEKVE